jgi:hypothetical protein
MVNAGRHCRKTSLSPHDDASNDLKDGNMLMIVSDTRLSLDVANSTPARRFNSLPPCTSRTLIGPCWESTTICDLQSTFISGRVVLYHAASSETHPLQGFPIIRTRIQSNSNSKHYTASLRSNKDGRPHNELCRTASARSAAMPELERYRTDRLCEDI